VPVLGRPSDLHRAVRTTGASQVVLAFPARPDRALLPLVRSCHDLGVDVSVVPRLFEHTNDHMTYEPVGGLPLLALGADRGRARRIALKHAVDRLVAGILVVLLAPLLLAIAVAVRLTTGGPVTFRQRRLGRDGREFDLLKFRSMQRTSAAEPVVVDVQSDLGPGGVEGEDRRTAVGRFLRRTSFDELLQLVNVVRGEMSLVGPRPERPELVELYSDTFERYADRLRMRPGISGLAQVKGLRGRTSLSERVELDNYYIEHWSFALDCKILLRTCIAAFRVPE
jgi:exopolysaccharide biosynthesis polyprenyl glycosylphosphotransferase